jgi:hypothetical protein
MGSEAAFDFGDLGGVLIFFQVLYIGIITVGTSVRCKKYKTAGLNRLDAPKPNPYKVKVVLQILMICI